MRKLNGYVPTYSMTSSARNRNEFWDREAKRLGYCEIDDEIEFGRRLDWDIAGHRPAQNLVDQLGGTPEQSRKVRSVGHESPGPLRSNRVRTFAPQRFDAVCH
jgi:hypothetical protein